MTRGIYSELDEFGRCLAQQTEVTAVSSQDLFRFQLNDQKNSEGSPEYLGYKRTDADIPELEGDVVAKIVEGEKDQWERLLESDMNSKLARLTNQYSLEEVYQELYVTAAGSEDIINI